MSEGRLTSILDAAYLCFTRHGVRRTTMDDIARAADVSRAALYQYVRGKDDAFLQLTKRLHEQALVRARTAAESDLTPAERIGEILGAKLDLVTMVTADSPHAAELIDASSRLCGEVVQNFLDELHALLTAAFAEADTVAMAPEQAADIAIALVQGLEVSPERAALLRPASDALIFGLTTKHQLS